MAKCKSHHGRASVSPAENEAYIRLGGLESLADAFGGGEEKETEIVPPPYLQLFLESD